MSAGRTLRVKAFAKINLSLHIVGVRSDGYHEIRTIFQAVSLFDTLTIRRRPGPFALTCDDPACPTDRTNLVSRAATAAWRASHRHGAPRDVAVHLSKRIPMQAGLGGGSSDAAAALRVFAAMWGTSAARVTAIARRLGADVRFFLEGGTALGVKRGDILVPIATPRPAHVVIVVPAFGISTKDAYGWFDRDRSAVRAQGRGKARVSGPLQTGAHRPLFNDLEAPVARRHPEISRVVAHLRRLGASHAAMSGSGSAIFGLFDSAAAAARAARAVGTGGRRVETARTLTRRECLALAAK